MSICHIFAAGDFCGDFMPEPEDIIIAADAGYTHLKRMNLLPHLLIGDFDTIDEIPQKIDNIIKFPSEKDYTDTQLAIEEGISRGYTKFIVYGALGGKKLEHTFANIQMAVGYSQKGCDITLTDGVTFVYAVHNSKITFDNTSSGYVSVFSASEKSNGVTLTGLKYTLNGATLTNDFALGVSNEFTGECAEISVADGTLIIITGQRRQNNEN